MSCFNQSVVCFLIRLTLISPDACLCTGRQTDTISSLCRMASSCRIPTRSCANSARSGAAVRVAALRVVERRATRVLSPEALFARVWVCRNWMRSGLCRPCNTRTISATRVRPSWLTLYPGTMSPALAFSLATGPALFVGMSVASAFTCPQSAGSLLVHCRSYSAAYVSSGSFSCPGCNVIVPTKDAYLRIGCSHLRCYACAPAPGLQTCRSCSAARTTGRRHNTHGIVRSGVRAGCVSVYVDCSQCGSDLREKFERLRTSKHPFAAVIGSCVPLILAHTLPLPRLSAQGECLPPAALLPPKITTDAAGTG